MGRIMIFTGKGGVGKTSIAAAHARHSALSGAKTLIVSTDMAHNLSDIFEMPLGKTVVEVSTNLYALEIDPNYLMENEFQDMNKALANMIQTSGLPLGDLEQLSIFPGMDELFSLLKIMAVYESDAYERIIVDCAPTGETLALLKFPELLSWYMEKFFPVGKIAMRVLSPISKVVFKVQLPNKAAMTDIQSFFLKLIQLQELLKDREVTSIRLVAMPEKMVVEETKRNYMYMNLYDFYVDGVYINRILPKDMDNPFFNEWIEIQRGYIEDLHMIFGEIPIYKIPWFECDLSGMKGIDKIEQTVMQDWDVFRKIDLPKGETYVKTEEGYLLKLHLPFVVGHEVDMHETKTDIIIKIGNFKRNIPKPSTLRNYRILSAEFDHQTLIIHLVENREEEVSL